MSQTSERTCRLVPGDARLTRRILKRCRQRGFEVQKVGDVVRIGHGRWGFRLDAYIVPCDIYDEEVARRSTEKEQEEKARAERLARERLAQLEQRRKNLAEKFPQLPQEKVESLLDEGRVVVTNAEVGYQFGMATKTYWGQLGYRVTGDASGYLVRGSRLYPVYRSQCLSEKHSRLTVKELLDAWRERFGSDEVVLAEAVRLANRLQKVKRHPLFYSLKDTWIKQNQGKLVEGRIARVENNYCWNCDGEGCWRCDDGVYSSRKLYEHTFKIGERTYSFHSYSRPSILSDNRGADLPHYGRPFNRDELPLPPQSVLVSLVRLLLGNEGVSSQPEESVLTG